MAESALAEARRAEAEILRGEWRGPLHGVPVALKDLIDTAGVRTTAASALYKDRVPDQDAEVVRRLRQAGAVILGKNNLHEFAYGGSSLVSYFGDVHNPWDVGRIAGGSSGGSAAAVVAGLAYAAIGTDTAGSIREPAALCGCVGLKPTYGRVSSRGVIPLSSSLDHVGPLAATVEDAAIVLQAIAGYDAADITSVDVPVADYVSALREGAKSVRVGVPARIFLRRSRSGSGVGDGTSSARNSKLWWRRVKEVRLGGADRPHAAGGRVVCLSRGERRRRLRSCTSLRLCGAFGREKRFRRRSTFERRRELEEARRSVGASLCRCGCAGDSDHADAGSGDCGIEGRSGGAASGGTEAAAQYATVQCVGIAGDLSALRIYAERTADRLADRGAALAGGFGVAVGARLRAGDGVAQAAMHAIARVSNHHQISRLSDLPPSRLLTEQFRSSAKLWRSRC